ELVENAPKLRAHLRACCIGLGDHEAVSQGNLLAPFEQLTVCQRKHRIDNGDETAEREPGSESAVRSQRLENRRRVGEARRLDDHSTEIGDSASLAVREKLAQRQVQIGANGAAHTSVAE